MQKYEAKRKTGPQMPGRRQKSFSVEQRLLANRLSWDNGRSFTFIAKEMKVSISLLEKEVFITFADYKKYFTENQDAC